MKKIIFSILFIIILYILFYTFFDFIYLVQLTIEHDFNDYDDFFENEFKVRSQKYYLNPPAPQAPPGPPGPQPNFWNSYNQWGIGFSYYTPTNGDVILFVSGLIVITTVTVAGTVFVVKKIIKVIS